MEAETVRQAVMEARGQGQGQGQGHGQGAPSRGPWPLFGPFSSDMGPYAPALCT